MKVLLRQIGCEGTIRHSTGPMLPLDAQKTFRKSATTLKVCENPVDPKHENIKIVYFKGIRMPSSVRAKSSSPTKLN